jgi:hypothetical protein
VLCPSEYPYTDFWLSWEIIVDGHSALRSLHHADVGGVADVLEIYDTSIFMTEVSRVGGYSCMYTHRFWSNRSIEGRVGAGASFGIRGSVDSKLSNDSL